ncbi:MAG TPA: ATP-binding protein [Allosphingosinicella sp.]
MGQYRPRRVLFGLAVAAAGVAAAVAAGAGLLSAVIVLFAGAGAALLIAGASNGAQADEQPAVIGNGEGRAAFLAQASVLDAIEDPLLVIRERRVALANAAAKLVLGDHIEDADIRLAIRHPAAAEKLANVDGDGRIELVGLGGDERRWEMIVAHMPDESRLVRLVDRSALHAAEQMRTDFIANASPELRTPLATILGFLETLQDDEAADPKTVRRFLRIMFDEASRMRQIVDDLISLSRIEAERYTLPQTPVDLLGTMEEVRGTLQNVARERKSEILVENLADGTAVAGDRAQLHQLFSNLVANALKYGREERPVRIRIENADAEMLRVSVIDEGEGIAPEHLPRLTERFYRVDAGRSRSVGGTGLGLAIVKHIVGRHRGRLDIRSSVGVGTEVHVYLPRWQDGLS